MIKLDGSLWNLVKTSGFSTSNDLDKKILTYGHPWEIIYKYLRLLSLSQGDYKYEQYCEKQQQKCMSYKNKTIEALMMYGDLQVLKLSGDTLALEPKAKTLTGYLKKHFVVYREKEFPEDGTQLYQELSRIFTFMYQ